MKKTLLHTTLLVIFGLMTASVFAQSCRTDTLLRYSISPDNSRTLTSRTIYEYNSKNVQTLETTQTFASNEWINSKQRSNTFNDIGERIETTEKRWLLETSVWENGSKSEYTYNSANKLLEVSHYLWNNSTNVWNPLSGQVYTYDANNRNTSYTSRIGILMEWRNVDQNTYANFDAADNAQLITTFKWNSTEMKYEPQYQYANTYNPNKAYITNESRRWDANSSSFIPQFKFTNTYNAENYITEGLHEIYSGTAFVNYTKTTYDYNESNKMTSRITQAWYGTEWVNDQKVTNEYNAANLVVRNQTHIWNGSSWAVVNKLISTYNIDNLEIRQTNINVNPANNAETINSEAEVTYNGTLKLTYTFSVWTGTELRPENRINYLYDASGRNIEQLSLGYNSTVLNLTPIYKWNQEYDASGFRTASEDRTNFDINTGQYNTGERNEYKCTIIQNNAAIAKIASSNVKVYPNPCTNFLTIADLLPTDKVQLMSSTGLCTEVPVQQSGIQVGELASGVYHLIIQSEDSIKRASFIKM